MSNSKRIDGIVKGLLGYARTEAKETYFSIFPLQEVIDLSIELLKIKYELHNFPLEIEIKCSDAVFGVKAQLMETIYNVLDNGYEAALDKKPHLSPEDAKTFIPAIKLKLTQTDAYSLIDISDNGIGIREEDKHKMFIPFFTTKSNSRSGTGIGMYVVKRIIEENHHGKAWFESVHGMGTHIFLKLPKPMEAVELKG
jgi:signal transduction histidine kinase